MHRRHGNTFSVKEYFFWWKRRRKVQKAFAVKNQTVCKGSGVFEERRSTVETLLKIHYAIWRFVSLGERAPSVDFIRWLSSGILAWAAALYLQKRGYFRLIVLLAEFFVGLEPDETILQPKTIAIWPIGRHKETGNYGFL